MSRPVAAHPLSSSRARSSPEWLRCWSDAPHLNRCERPCPYPRTRPFRYFWCGSLPLENLDYLRNDLTQVVHDPVVGRFENGRVSVLVDGHYDPGTVHAGEVLHGTGDPQRKVEIGRDRFAGLPDLLLMLPPPGVHDSARTGNGGTQCFCQRLDVIVEAVRTAYPATSSYHGLSFLELHAATFGEAPLPHAHDLVPLGDVYTHRLHGAGDAALGQGHYVQRDGNDDRQSFCPDPLGDPREIGEPGGNDIFALVLELVDALEEGRIQPHGNTRGDGESHATGRENHRHRTDLLSDGGDDSSPGLGAHISECVVFNHADIFHVAGELLCQVAHVAPHDQGHGLSSQLACQPGSSGDGLEGALAQLAVRMFSNDQYHSYLFPSLHLAITWEGRPLLRAEAARAAGQPRPVHPPGSGRGARVLPGFVRVFPCALPQLPHR